MRYFLAVLFVCLLSFGAHAQDAKVVQSCGTLPLAYTAGSTALPTVDVNGNLCLVGAAASSIDAGGATAIANGSLNGILYESAAGKVAASSGITASNTTLTGTTSGLNKAFVTSQTGTGTGVDSGAVSFSFNFIDITSDTVQAANGVAGLYVQETVSTGATGVRAAVLGKTSVTGTPADVAPGNFYGGAWFWGDASVNAGGTGGSPSGEIFGTNPQATLEAGATHYWSLTGEEIDVVAITGSSTKYKIGLDITTAGADAVQGGTLDAALVISAVSGSPGWNYGIDFSNFNRGGSGAFPVASGGTIIGADTSGTVTNTIDFHNVGCSGGNALRLSTTLTVDCSGNLTANTVRASSVGSASAPSLIVGNATTGFYSVSTTGLGAAVNGVLEGDWGITSSGNWTLQGAVRATTNLVLTSSAGLLSINAGNAFLSYGGALGAIQHGNADAAAPQAQTIQAQSVVAGTSNTAGANLIIQGSRGTGTGPSGNILIQVGKTGSTGSTQNTAYPLISANAGNATGATVQFGDGTNFTTYDSCTALTTGATGVIACTASASRFKNILAPITPDEADAGLNLLRVGAPVWEYKNEYKERFGNGYRVGLIADDVARMNPDCVVTDAEGTKDYWDRCIIAYLVADRQKMKSTLGDMESKIESLERRVH